MIIPLNKLTLVADHHYAVFGKDGLFCGTVEPVLIGEPMLWGFYPLDHVGGCGPVLLRHALAVALKHRTGDAD